MEDLRLLEKIDFFFFSSYLGGGFGLLWVIDAILIIVSGLPDHNGCALVAPF